MQASPFVGRGYFNSPFPLLHRGSCFWPSSLPLVLLVPSFSLDSGGSAPPLTPLWLCRLPALETHEFSSKPNLNSFFFQENPTLPQPRINLFLFSTPSIFSILLTRSPCPLHTICGYIFCCLY